MLEKLGQCKHTTYQIFFKDIDVLRHFKVEMLHIGFKWYHYRSVCSHFGIVFYVCLLIIECFNSVQVGPCFIFSVKVICWNCFCLSANNLKAKNMIVKIMRKAAKFCSWDAETCLRHSQSLPKKTIRSDNPFVPVYSSASSFPDSFPWLVLHLLFCFMFFSLRLP